MKCQIFSLLVLASCLYSQPGMAHETETKPVVLVYLINPETSLNKSEIAQASSVEEITPLHRPNPDEEPFKPEKLPFKEETTTQETPPKGNPSITILTPSGYGLDWGNIAIGVGYQQRTRFTDEDDGVIGIGIGLGDAKKYVGLQVGIALVDISDPFADGSISLKLHRQLPSGFGVAVGIQGVDSWGVTDGGSGVYGVLSKRFTLQDSVSKPLSEIYTSIGVGGGQFRSESDIRQGIESVGVFGSVALRVFEPVNFIIEWSGQDLSLGVSLAPFRNVPLVIIPAVTDITGTAGDGARFILGVAYKISF
jgi:hypothetical protein